VSERWHPYVFDTERRRFVGNFEGMYQAEARGRFDSWHQSDPRLLEVGISMLLLSQITFHTAVDLGCGKGWLTARLKRRDNRVVGVDHSATAIAEARARFSDIEWVCSTIDAYLERGDACDLIVMREVLSYLEDWRSVLADCSRLARYLLVGLYVPPDPIGFVGSHAELRARIDDRFAVLEEVVMPPRRMAIYLCESRP
jgi:2-polyprenyl-3-methyl-5-hydroxy-6-metoxy-1,4-benzoquinol methylase